MNTGATISLTDVFLRLGIALALGLLVGLERERSDSQLAGFRTFPLATLLGSLATFLVPVLGGWLPAAALVALAATIGIGNLIVRQNGDRSHTGITTEVALLTMFLVGAGIAAGFLVPCVVLAGGIAVLLHAKQPMHSFARGLSQEDVVVLFRFVLLALVVLPVLPDRAYGPFEVLNPREIWWMVVLIVGLGLASYVAYRLFGSRGGTLLAGVLGGLISSTATTVSYARRARTTIALAGTGALVIAIASTVVFARLVLLLLAVAPDHAPALLPPLLALLAAFVCLCAVFWRRSGAREAALEHSEQAAELRPALVFALVYAAVLFGVAAARHYFTDPGALYAVAALSGLSDVDAITLSTARLVDAGRLEADTAWRLIVVATLSNLAFKAALAFVLGGRALGVRLLPFFALGIAAGTALVVFWR